VQAELELSASPTHDTSARLGMIVFLASDVMLFSAFFTAYYLLRSVAEEWPPEGVELDVPRAAIATAVLVGSSGTMIAVDRAIVGRDRRAARRWLIATIALGVVFAANQFAEYATIGFAIDDHPYGSAYWTLTGVHGLHVTAGVATLAMLFVRLVRAGDLTDAEPFAAAASMYWHMVDVVWIAVFLTIWVVK
jgi:cytochrome c oxidase subunit III